MVLKGKVDCEPFTINIGIRQGECFSLFLSAMYVNDLEVELTVNDRVALNFTRPISCLTITEEGSLLCNFIFDSLFSIGYCNITMICQVLSDSRQLLSHLTAWSMS